MSKHKWISLFAVAGLLAGCGNAAEHTSYITPLGANLEGGRISLDSGNVVLHANGAPDATIGVDGDFRIDGKSVAVDPAERAQLRRYHDSVIAMRDDGIATGKLGAALAGRAISSVIRNLAQGSPDKIDQEVNPQADKIEHSALKICTDLVGVKAAQDALAAQLPAFKPYADTVETRDTTDCNEHISVADARTRKVPGYR